ncbi:hypothetical protein QU870_25150, partial [Escherichia coli]|nr:hypothetical protein [Escherichia coli]
INANYNVRVATKHSSVIRMKPVSGTFYEGDFDDCFHPKIDSRDIHHAVMRIIKWSHKYELR